MAFDSSYSCRQPLRYNTVVATANADAAVQFNQVLCASRLTRHLTLMAAQLSQGDVPPEECERQLNDWLGQLVRTEAGSGDPLASALRPLAGGDRRPPYRGPARLRPGSGSRVRSRVAHVADSGSAIRKGANIGVAQPWAPAPKVRPFSVNQFAVNSDIAFRTAAAKAADWLKANPNPAKKVKLYLSGETRFPTAAWYVMWGDQKSGYLAFVDATTGIALNVK